MSDGVIQRNINLDVRNTLIGNESRLPIEIKVNNTHDSFSREDNIGNNEMSRDLEVVAISIYTTEM